MRVNLRTIKFMVVGILAIGDLRFDPFTLTLTALAVGMYLGWKYGR